MSSGNRRPLMFSTIVVIATIIMLFQFFEQSLVVIPVLAISSILLIIAMKQTSYDAVLEGRHLPGFEGWISLLALGVGIMLGALSVDGVIDVIIDKSEIIALILSFAIISKGVGNSKFFAFSAYKIVQRSQGNTTRVILYLFILTSILTFLTSNDIVILVMTPIIVSVCFQASISNARLLLLSQFVAANTISMGLLIGSPTNIIISEAIGIDFITYFLMMFVPTIAAFVVTFIVIDFINRLNKPKGIHHENRFSARWAYQESYHIPAIAHAAHFTSHMRNWILIFGISIIILIFVTGYELSLWYAAIPTSVVSLLWIYGENRRGIGVPGNISLSRSESSKYTWDIISELPYGIFFFAITFFSMADVITSSEYMLQVILPELAEYLSSEDVLYVSLMSIFGSGVLVNIINDLPASAMIGSIMEYVASTDSINKFSSIVLVQSLLVGLNIGCYVTPIGALAGLLWFNILRSETRKHTIEHEVGEFDKGNEIEQPKKVSILVPDMMDLIKYGSLIFFIIGTLMGIIVPFFAQIIDSLISSPSMTERSAQYYHISGDWLPYVGSIIVVIAIIWSRSIINRNNVLLAHLQEVFVVLTKLTVWSMQHKMLYHFFIGVTFIGICGSALYWAEYTHEGIYGAFGDKNSLFSSPKEFVVWLTVFIGSGFEHDYFPRSTLGMAITGFLPIATIGVIVMIARVTTQDSVKQLVLRMARGEIPGYRIIVVNYHQRLENFIKMLLRKQDAFVTLLCSPDQFGRASLFAKSVNESMSGSHRVLASVKNTDAYYDFQEYDFKSTSEIYILSNLTDTSEFENLRYLTKLDNTISTLNVEGQTAVTDDMEYVHFSLPRIIIEASSERYRSLIIRSISPILKRVLVSTTFTSDISDALISDLDDSLCLLNHYYKLDGSYNEGDIFVNGVEPGTKIKLTACKLSSSTQKKFNEYFDFTGANEDFTYRHSIEIRSGIKKMSEGCKVFTDGKETLCDDAKLYGLVAKMMNWNINFGIPSASLSMQSSKADHAIMKEMNGDQDFIYCNEPTISNIGQIFIFNVSPLSKKFARTLLQTMETSSERLIILALGSQDVPNDIANNSAVLVINSDTVNNIIDHIFSGENSRTNEISIQPGDRIYAFSDPDDVVNREATCVEFIDELDNSIRLSMGTDNSNDLLQSNLYVAVEVQNDDSRFLFERLFVDKIFDSTLPRSTYFELLSNIHQKIIKEYRRVGSDSSDELRSFHFASKVAEYFCRFKVLYANESAIKNDRGDIIDVRGLKFEDAVRTFRSYSSPSYQLLYRVRLVTDQKQPHGHLIQLVDENAEEDSLIKEDDLLVCIPII